MFKSIILAVALATTSLASVATAADTWAMDTPVASVPYWELSWEERSRIQIEEAVAKAKAERAAETDRPVGGGGQRSSR